MWGSFQVRYYRVTGKSLQFPRLKILIVVISSGCLLCAVLFLLALNALLDGKKKNTLKRFEQNVTNISYNIFFYIFL